MDAAVTLLPAVVPPLPTARAEVVPARLAAKVAPLFGVPWADSPFGDATWVSDFRRITLSEIARGAPLPTRSQAPALLAELGDGGTAAGWGLVNRIGVTVNSGSLPNEIPNATLNRFGPDTKAAVVLTAVNLLLEPLRRAVEDAVALLADETGKALPPALRLAGWASLIVEIFRSQPALVSAGILARAIQRPLTDVWDVPVAASADGVPLSRCEVSFPGAPVAPSRPRTLDVADATFDALRLQAAHTESGQVPERTLTETHETVVGALLTRLLDVGTLRDASHLWLAQRRPGQLAMEALLTPASIVNRFVHKALRLAGIEDASLDIGAPLPWIPSPRKLDGLGTLSRRAAALALLGVLQQVRQPAAERARDAPLACVRRLRDLVEEALPDDDPVRAVVACRADVIAVDLARADAASPHLAELSAQLDESTRRCQRLFEAGVLDRGAAAEMVAASNIQVNALRSSNARAADSGLPSPAELERRLRQRWRHWLELVEASEDMLTGERQPPGMLGYHLHNYAAFLASLDAEEDRVAAVRLFREVVIPARRRFFESSGIFDALAYSLQMATRATTALAEQAREHAGPGGLRRARDWAKDGHRFISDALGQPALRAMVAATTEASCRFALRAAPALLLAVELDATEDPQADLDRADGLIDVARTWAQCYATENNRRYARYDEIEKLECRLAELRSLPLPGPPPQPRPDAR
ncbi:MAG: hypothetical protein IRZ08_13110 [Frankia sp.]|nr:hypothetical protein [Frankia sp.]